VGSNGTGMVHGSRRRNSDRTLRNPDGVAFMAFAPSAFAYPWVVFGSSIAIGLASCYPRRFDPSYRPSGRLLIVMLGSTALVDPCIVGRFPQISHFMKIDLYRLGFCAHLFSRLSATLRSSQRFRVLPSAPETRSPFGARPRW
jgi:hypothetical protein